MKEKITNPRLEEPSIKSVADDSGLRCETWLKESRAKAVSHVYAPEVLSTILVAVNKKSTSLKPIDLSEAYLKEAGALSQERAIQAAYRLKVVWEKGLAGGL